MEAGMQERQSNFPEDLLSQAEDRVINGRPYRVIPVIRMTCKEVMTLLDCPKSTARDSVRRGYYIITYANLKRPHSSGRFDPEQAWSQSKDRIINGRPRKYVPVMNATCREVMAMFACPRRTAQDAVKRGWYIVDYTKRTIIPGRFDPEQAYRMAWGVYYRQFHGRVPWWAEAYDLVQEGVERLIQQAGHPRMVEDVFAFRAVKYAMVEYLRKNRRLNAEIYEEKLRPGVRADFMAAWQAERDGECQACGSGSPDTWGRSQTQTERMVRKLSRAQGVTA
jgi:hypothetical protein